MSFISSVFGMNNKEIAGQGAPMTLADQFKWMCKMKRTSPNPPVSKTKRKKRKNRGNTTNI